MDRRSGLKLKRAKTVCCLDRECARQFRILQNEIRKLSRHIKVTALNPFRWCNVIGNVTLRPYVAASQMPLLFKYADRSFAVQDGDKSRIPLHGITLPQLEWIFILQYVEISIWPQRRSVRWYITNEFYSVACSEIVISLPFSWSERGSGQAWGVRFCKRF
jgi:hypothetical protein